MMTFTHEVSPASNEVFQRVNEVLLTSNEVFQVSPEVSLISNEVFQLLHYLILTTISCNHSAYHYIYEVRKRLILLQDAMANCGYSRLLRSLPAGVQRGFPPMASTAGNRTK